MIKITTPAIHRIASQYFLDIHPKMAQRISFYSAILDYLFAHGSLNAVQRHPLHGKTKLSLVNSLLNNDTQVAKNNDYTNLTTGNLRHWVVADIQILRDVLTHFSTLQNLKDMILVSPEDAYDLDISLQHLYGINPITHERTVIPFINTIFNYDLFDKFSYDIAAEIGISTCPYCNRTFINTVFDDNKNKVIRATFDHFFPKSKHPFLALSFYNLIPSCHWCNENLKLDADIGFDTQIHPYHDGYGNDCKFRFLISGLHAQKSDPRNYRIVLETALASTSAKYRRIFGTAANEGSNNLFKIREIYNSHTDIVGEIVTKADRYSQAHVQSITAFFGGLNTNKTEFYQFYFGNYFNEHDHHRRPFAKFTRDIVEQILPNFI